jgi:hypothetical protein
MAGEMTVAGPGPGMDHVLAESKGRRTFPREMRQVKSIGGEGAIASLT